MLKLTVLQKESCNTCCCWQAHKTTQNAHKHTCNTTSSSSSSSFQVAFSTLSLWKQQDAECRVGLKCVCGETVKVKKNPLKATYRLKTGVFYWHRLWIHTQFAAFRGQTLNGPLASPPPHTHSHTHNQISLLPSFCASPDQTQTFKSLLLWPVTPPLS